MRVEEDKAKGSTGRAVLPAGRSCPPEIRRSRAEIRRLLKLAPDQQRFVLTYSPVRGAENELAVNSRSMLQIMHAFASYLDVPEATWRTTAAAPAFESAARTSGQDECAHSQRQGSSPRMPSSPCTTASTGSGLTTATGRPSARSRAIMFFFTLADTGGSEKLPLVTIPAQ